MQLGLLLGVAVAAFGGGYLWGQASASGQGASGDVMAASAGADAAPVADVDAEAAAKAAARERALTLLVAGPDELRRLRQQLIKKEQRIEALTEAVGNMQQAVGRDERGYARVSRTSEREINASLRDLNRALVLGGAPDVAVLEVGSFLDGRAYELLVSCPPEPGLAAQVGAWTSARLLVADGLARLELERPSADDEGVPEIFEILLPNADEELFASAGLSLPDSEVLVAQASSALRALLSEQPFDLVSVGGVRDQELLDVELLEFEGGVLRRRMRAGRVSVLAAGPTLLLQDGEVTVDGETRGFYRGALRLPLPGASYSDWLEMLLE
ncbi:MAG: hypothetical protein DRQ55_01180 [Planctomycetota bacterium]|nr:MAG: hypothetical protein DRQ55_01180 [Planctomycetota bacterium]